jgi:hypothetical protein
MRCQADGIRNVRFPNGISARQINRRFKIFMLYWNSAFSAGIVANEYLYAAHCLYNTECCLQALFFCNCPFYQMNRNVPFQTYKLYAKEAFEGKKNLNILLCPFCC